MDDNRSKWLISIAIFSAMLALTVIYGGDYKTTGDAPTAQDPAIEANRTVAPVGTGGGETSRQMTGGDNSRGGSILDHVQRWMRFGRQ